MKHHVQSILWKDLFRAYVSITIAVGKMAAGRQACRWNNSCKLISIHKPETKRANLRKLKVTPQLHTSSSMILTPNSMQTATNCGSSTQMPETETSHSNYQPLFSSYLPFCVCLFLSLPRTFFKKKKTFIVSFF